VFVGYAGWDAGQLEGELREGAWFVLDADPEDALTACPDQL
jgi:putative transcriptional regulator